MLSHDMIVDVCVWFHAYIVCVGIVVDPVFSLSVNVLSLSGSGVVCIRFRKDLEQVKSCQAAMMGTRGV